MSKQNAISRWNGRLHRYGEHKMEDDRWQRDRRGNWRRKADECTEQEYCERRRERSGFHRGARVGSRLTN
jgi:hypothetical protein